VATVNAHEEGPQVTWSGWGEWRSYGALVEKIWCHMPGELIFLSFFLSTLASSTHIRVYGVRIRSCVNLASVPRCGMDRVDACFLFLFFLRKGDMLMFGGWLYEGKNI